MQASALEEELEMSILDFRPAEYFSVRRTPQPPNRWR